MNNVIRVAPSILSADFSILGKEVQKVEKAGAEWLHIDVMDGNFVPNITIGPCVIKSLRKQSGLVFDVHLMIDRPILHVDTFADSGADLITFHIEASKSPEDTIKKIRNKGKKVGVSVKPGTGIDGLKKILDKIDMILVMSVEPGFAGQKFMESSLPKITELRKVFAKDIQVDGGMNDVTAKRVIKAGANIIVAGSYIFGKEDCKKAIDSLRK